MSVLMHFALTSLGQSTLTSNFDVMLRILGLGTIGLGFLLAFLAFRLLNREQNIKAPRDVILTSITRFMVFSFLLCALGLFSEIWRNYAPKPTSEPLGGALYWLPPEETQAATQVAQKFLEQIDAGQLQEAYDSTSAVFKRLATQTQFKDSAAALLQSFGAARNRRFDTALKGGGMGPDGPLTVYYVNFRTLNETIANSAETVTLIKSDDGVFKVFGFGKRP